MFYKRMALLAALLWACGGLCAFDLQYGSFFRIGQISLKDGRPVLPVNGKYANVRVLDRDTFEILKACSGACVQPAQAAELSLRELRPAKTRENMWIGEVAFNGQWLVTFLVFKNKDGFAVKEPKQFVFLDDVLKRRVADLLTQAIEVSK